MLTDRFVDGDPGNNQPEQGGAEWHTFDRPLTKDGNEIDNIGYLGGDFRGILDNADYIAEMGFTAVWITPIVENPDEAFTGGHPCRATFLRRPGQGRLSRLLGRELLRSRRAPADRRDSISRTSCDRCVTNTDWASCSTSSRITARRPSRCRSTSPCTARSTTRTAAWSPTTRTFPPEQLDPQSAARILSAATRSRGTRRHQLGESRRARVFRRGVCAAAGRGCRCFSHRHDPAHAAFILEGFCRAHAREASRVFHVRRGVQLRGGRDCRAHPAGRTAASACSTSR